MRAALQPAPFTLSTTTFRLAARIAAISTSASTFATCVASAEVSRSMRPNSVGPASFRSRSLKRRTISFASSGGGATPSPSRHFRPFHSIGLWLAVHTMPPSALWCCTITPAVGVMAMPRSITSQPVLASPAATALRKASPLGRESRASTTRGRSFLLRR